jgi:DNA polymerase-4
MSYRIAYAEVPWFYVSVARQDNPALRGQAVIIGGDPDKRGKVQSASHEALSCGVTVGMAVADAHGLCPEAVLLRTDVARYREVSALLKSTLRTCTLGIEVDGNAGAYLELEPDSLRDEASANATARGLADRVREELGLPLRVGIAPVKFLSKLAALESGPEGVCCIAEADVADFLAALPPERLPGVGAKTREALAEMKIATIGELLARGDAEVESRLGTHGRRILAHARGEDGSQVRSVAHPMSLSHDFTFEEPVLERAAVESCLARLCKTAEGGLQQQQLCARRVAIKLRYAEGTTATRTRTFKNPLFNASEIHFAALRLLDRTEAGKTPLRLIGIALAGLGPKPEPDAQLELFER